MKDIIMQLAYNNNKITNQPRVWWTGNRTNDLWNTVQNILTAIIASLGVVCVVVMLIGGINYMTSTGDTGKVKKAKDTILYGLIGLIVCVLSFAIVNWLLGNIIQ